MFENKGLQQGPINGPNALVAGQTYDLELKTMSHMDAPGYGKMIHIKDHGAHHSNFTYIHPNYTSAPGEDMGGNAFTLGCKAVTYEADAEISRDQTDIFSQQEFRFTQNASGKWGLSRKAEKAKQESWQTSWNAFLDVRGAYQKNQKELQKNDNFELKVLPATPAADTKSTAIQ